MFAKSILLAAFAAVASAQSLLINTPPSLFTCQPYAVNWSGGQAPYFVSVIPGGDQSAAPLLTLGDQPTTATSYVWNVNIAAGTSITLRISDQAGIPAFSAPVTIQAGSSTSCVGQANASGSSSAAAGSSAASSSAPASSSAASSSAASSSAATSASSASRASSVVSAASSSAASVASSASGVVGSAASGASSAAAAATSRPASAGNKVAFSGLALFGAAALAVVA